MSVRVQNQLGYERGLRNLPKDTKPWRTAVLAMLVSGIGMIALTFFLGPSPWGGDNSSRAFWMFVFMGGVVLLTLGVLGWIALTIPRTFSDVGNLWSVNKVVVILMFAAFIFVAQKLYSFAASRYRYDHSSLVEFLALTLFVAFQVLLKVAQAVTGSNAPRDQKAKS